MDIFYVKPQSWLEKLRLAGPENGFFNEGRAMDSRDFGVWEAGVCRGFSDLSTLSLLKIPNRRFLKKILDKAQVKLNGSSVPHSGKSPFLQRCVRRFKTALDLVTYADIHQRKHERELRGNIQYHTIHLYCLLCLSLNASPSAHQRMRLCNDE